jgi:crossover junction endodeoxyribonuclease RusA
VTTYRLTLPYERPPKSLTGNTRSHWRARSADTRTARETVAWLAKQAGIPQAKHLTVQLVWAPGDRRRRDADNLVPFMKSLCDGIARGNRQDWTGLELVPDDTPKFMNKIMPRILTPDECNEVGMWFLVTVDEEAA